MWQQGFYQQWPFSQQQGRGEVDWGALAQAWIQNKSMQSQNQPQESKDASVAVNQPLPATNNSNQIPQQQMTWPQQQVWPNPQWNTSNWNNSQGPYQQQQWPMGQSVGQQQPIPQNLNSNDHPPLPPLPPGDPDYVSELPPGVDANDDTFIPERKTEDVDMSSDNNYNQPPGIVKKSDETQSSEYNTPPQNFQHQPQMQQFDSSKHEEGGWNQEWKPPNSNNWPPLRPSVPPGPQWNGRGRGRMQQPWVRGPLNSIQQQNQQEVTNNNVNTGTDQAKRKVLPAWIREGLERIEQEKQRRSEREQNAAKEIAEKESKKDVSEKSKFESESDAESDAELPQQEDVPAPAGEEEVQREVSEEEKNELLMLKVRKLLTEVLLDVTNEEISSIVHRVYAKATKAPAKQLAQSSALSSISNFGVVDGYSSDNNSEDEIKDEKDGDANDESLDEENLEEKVEAFNIKQMIRLKKLEEDGTDSTDEKTSAEKLETNATSIDSKPPYLFDYKKSKLNTKKRSDANVMAKTRNDRSSSSSSEERKKLLKASKSSRLSQDSYSKEGKNLSKKTKQRRSRSKSRDRKRSRSRDRKRSRSKDRKRRKHETPRSDSRERRNSSRKASFDSLSRRSSKSRKQSKSDRTPERPKEKSSRKESQSLSRNWRDDSSDKSSNPNLQTDSSDSDVKSRKKKKLKKKKKKKHSSKLKYKSSSSDDSSSSSSSSSDDSDQSDIRSRSRDRDKYRKSHGKRKSKRH